MNPIQRKYGVATDIFIPVYNTAGDELYHVTSLPSGDTLIAINGGAPADTTNQPTKWHNSFVGVYKLSLTAAEMSGAHIDLKIEDATATKVFMDSHIAIETYGHASAQHQMDMDFPTLAKSFTTTAAGSLTTVICSDLGSTNSTWVDRTVLFHGGNLDGRIAFIEAYDTGAANTLTISQIHTASLSGQAFYIL